jgi:CarD family transcriptional regulator
MRRLLSEDEIYSLIRSMPDEDTIWIDNETARKEQYRAILSDGDRLQLMRLIKTLFLRERELKEVGKKLYAIDERFMREAEKMLYEEFAHVLNIKPDQVVPLISEQIEVSDVEKAQTV